MNCRPWTQIVSLVPLGMVGCVVSAESCTPAFEDGGWMMLGSLANVITVITARISDARAATPRARVRMRSGARRERRRRELAAVTSGRKARHSTHAAGLEPCSATPYTGRSLRRGRAIRTVAWALVAAGIAAPP